jgi:hypothetical protein
MNDIASRIGLFCQAIRGGKEIEAGVAYSKLNEQDRNTILNTVLVFFAQYGSSMGSGKKAILYAFFNMIRQYNVTLFTALINTIPNFGMKLDEFGRRINNGPSTIPITKPAPPEEKRKRAPKTKKKYDKKYQKYEEPLPNSSQYTFYTSLYAEKGNSSLAITWLTEHGVFENNDPKRAELVRNYEELVKKGQVFKLR